MERDVELLRTRVEGELHWERAHRLLAAVFVHTSSRLTRDQESGGVPDPQLHSHVVVLGAERINGRFAAVDSRELFRSARANGAWYRAELAAGLQQLGLEIRGRTGKDGRYFEVAGVPEALSERWSMRGAEIERVARVFRTRYGREPRAGELSSITVGTRGTKTSAAPVDVDASWRAVGEEYGLTRDDARSLYSLDRVTRVERDLGRDLLGDVTRDRSTVSDRDLHARAYELAAGTAHPREADVAVAELARSGELVALADGRWTTRELRELEQMTLNLARERSSDRVAPVSDASIRESRLAVQQEIGGLMSSEQRRAVETITGPGGVSVLVGQAGTGKGVVIAAGAWERDGYAVIGTAVAGATAERLGADTNLESSVTNDALMARVESGGLQMDSRTVVVMDEAGMADTRRLAALTELTAERNSKLVLVGDQAQLPSIGAGGMFEALQENVPTAEVTEVRRAEHAWEREAWQQLRTGEAESALASYQARDRLHISDTREEAVKRMVEDWDQTRREHPGGRAVMLTDASNVELDRINALAQEGRAQAGELGANIVELPGRAYGLSAGDEVIFSASLQPPGQPRVENGTLGTVTEAVDTNHLSIETKGSEVREVHVDTKECSDLRLSYAQHVYKAQGRTVDRAFVLTGGWQTGRERSYVALSRAKERTDIYVSREDLGEEGMDPGAIERLGAAMSESHAQEPSIATPVAQVAPVLDGDLLESGRESEAARAMRDVQAQHDRDSALECGLD